MHNSFLEMAMHLTQTNPTSRDLSHICSIMRCIHPYHYLYPKMACVVVLPPVTVHMPHCQRQVRIEADIEVEEPRSDLFWRKIDQHAGMHDLNMAASHVWNFLIVKFENV